MSYLNKKKISDENFIDKGLAFLLFVAMAAIPLIVSIKIVPVSVHEYGIIRANKNIRDMFSYHKAVALCIDAMLIVLYMAAGKVLEEKRAQLRLKALPSYLMYTYLGLCLLSAIFSPYKDVAFLGISERYEGMLVLLAYGVLFLSAMAFVSNMKALRAVMLIFCGSAVILGIIPTMQTFGYDFFATDAGSKMVLGNYYSGENLSLNFTSAYGTLYNPNCLGMYGGMMSCLTLVPTLTLPFKNKAKYAFALGFVLSLIGMLGSDSLGGIMGFGAGCAVGIVVAVIRFFTLKMYKNKLYLAMAVALCVVSVCVPGLLLTTNTIIAQKAEIIISALKGGNSGESPFFYEDFVCEGNTAGVITKAGTISVTDKGDEVVLDEDGIERTPVKVERMEDVEGNIYTYKLTSVSLAELQVYEDKRVLTCFDEGGNETRFLMGITEKGMVPLDKFGKVIDLSNPVKAVGFEGVERLGSGRGFIWSRSIPLMLKNIVIGKGPDSFELEFPQEDIIAKLRYLGNPYIIVDKPHSIYLQNAINTGVLSMLVFAALGLLMIIQTAVKLIRVNEDSLVNTARLAVLCAVTAYMVAGATTDSVVSVAPVFWIILGAGYGINFIKVERKENGEA